MKARIIPGTSRKNLSQMRRWIKLLCIVLHNDFGFGVDRLGQVMDGISKLSDEEKCDPVFWEHADKLLIDQMKIKFDREDYKQVDK